MPDNVLLNLGSGGPTAAAREISHGGDTAQLQGVFLMGISGSEGSYTAAAINGDATNGIDVDVTRVPQSGNVDTAAGATQIGVPALTVRDDALATLTEADGDLSLARVNARGALWVALDATVAQNITIIANTPGTGAANLGKAEDAAHGSGDTGVMMLAVRNDAGTALAGTTGDYIPMSTDSSGALRVVGSTATTQYAEDAASAGAESLCLMGAVRRDSAASSSGTDGDYSTLNTDATGNLRVAVSAGGVAGVVEDVASAGAEEGILAMAIRQDTIASNTSADGDFTNLKVSSIGRLYTANDLTHVGGTAVASNNGTASAGCARVVIASDNTAFTVTSQGSAAQDAAIAGSPVPTGWRASTATPTAMSADGDVVYPWATRNGAAVVAGEVVDDAAFTVGTTRVVPVGFLADEASTDSVNEDDVGAARMTLDRKVIITNYGHAAAGGATPYKNLDCDETEDDIKTSAGKLFWLHVMNLHASSTRYLKFYNATAANVSVGTTVPVHTFAIPSNVAGFTLNFGSQGLQFDTAICVAATTGFADNDTGAPGTNEVILNAGYL